MRDRIRRHARAVWLLGGLAVAGAVAAPLAFAAGGGPIKAEQRNPVHGTYSQQTLIIADNDTYATRQSNKGTGGGAVYGCRTTPGNEPCVRAANLRSGLAFRFETSGATGGQIQVGAGGDKAKPFTTNATGVATGLNADRVDGLNAQQIIAAAKGAGSAACPAGTVAYAGACFETRDARRAGLRRRLLDLRRRRAPAAHRQRAARAARGQRRVPDRRGDGLRPGQQRRRRRLRDGQPAGSAGQPVAGHREPVPLRGARRRAGGLTLDPAPAGPRRGDATWAGDASHPRGRGRAAAMAPTRVLVVGSGHNGLVAAIHLARAGLQVTVLESAPVPGGATRSQALTLPGFVHDLHAAFVPMTAVSPAMRELELERHGVQWVNPATVVAHPFEDGRAIVLHRDVEATADSLGAAGAAWRAAMGELLPIADPLARTILSPLPPVRGVAPVVRGLGRDLVLWARRMLSSVQALGLELFDGDRRATAWLSASAQHSGLPPTTTVSGAFGLLLQLVGHSHGWPLPRGGMSRIVDALLAMATGAGAQVRCDAPVEQIVVRDGRVRGVRLRGGEELGAEAVVSTVTALPLVRMLPAGALPGRLELRLKAWRYSTGPFKLDYALSGPVPWAAAEARRSGVVHVAGELEALTGAAQAGERGDVPQRPALVVGQQSLHDPTRAPDGQHTLYVYGHVPSRYDARGRRGRRAHRGPARALRPRLRRPRAGPGDAPAPRVGGRQPQPGRRRPGRRLLRARPAAGVPPAPGADALPRAAARPLRRRRLDPPGRRRARHQRAGGGAGAAARPPDAAVARPSASRLRRRSDSALRSRTSGSVSGLNSSRPIRSIGFSIIVTSVRPPSRGTISSVTRATPNGRALARSSRWNGGSTSSTSVWSSVLSGPTPTRW